MTTQAAVYRGNKAFTVDAVTTPPLPRARFRSTLHIAASAAPIYIFIWVIWMAAWALNARLGMKCLV
jgi:hypothetical protein